MLRSAVIVLCAAVSLSAAAADTRLIDAVKSGDTSAVRTLLRQRVSVSTTEADGTTALHWAVRGDRLEVARALVRAGAPVNAANRYGVTPLALAASAGSSSIVDLLLKSGANPNATSADGETVLMTAARSGRAEVVDLILAAGAHVSARESWHGETALMWAAGEDHADVIERLVAKGADVNARSKLIELPKVKVDFATMVMTALPRGNMTALMFAAREGAHDATHALAEAGADLNATDPDGASALVIAIINAHYDVAELLIRKGADVNLADASGMAPLYAAIDMKHQEPLINRPLPKPSGLLRPLDVIQHVLARGADPNAALQTPLLMRQHNGGDSLLGKGATPLMRAAKASDVELMRLLLEEGADPTRALENQTTALMIAASRSGRVAASEQDTLAAVDLLIERGADINAANANGETALHLAVGRGDELVKGLAQRGSKLEAKDKFGRTPRDVALGVPGGRGRGGSPPEPAPVRESTAALLRQLMRN